MDLRARLNRITTVVLKTLSEDSGDETFITTVILGIQADIDRRLKRRYTKRLAAGMVMQPVIYYIIGTFNALFFVMDIVIYLSTFSCEPLK